jgi:hypothetical protein
MSFDRVRKKGPFPKLKVQVATIGFADASIDEARFARS